MIDSTLRHRVDRLLGDFGRYVSVGCQQNPFTRAGQSELHLKTIRLRRAHGTVRGALADADFIDLLYATLQAWGVGIRGSVLTDRAGFGAELSRFESAMTALEDSRIDSLDGGVLDDLWGLFENLEIVENVSRIVPVSKTLHHLLPDLVPPIDRAYTGRFLGHQMGFQNAQRSVFDDAFEVFGMVASEVDLDVFVGDGWNSSSTKVIDNAIIGYCISGEIGRESATSVRHSELSDPLRASWSLADLREDLQEFERDLIDAGLARNTVSTYIGRADTFLRWLGGSYRPRGPNA